MPELELEAKAISLPLSLPHSPSPLNA
ncbi:hypothetical protein TIFTF001_024572, partial [Ficus carica]